MSDVEYPIASRKLFDLFRQYADRRFLFVEPGGNHGDYLIYRGAEKVARIAGIEFRSVPHATFVKEHPGDGDVVYIHGGGGCVPFYSGTPVAALRLAVSTHSGLVILGPQTFWAAPDYLRTVFEGTGPARPLRVVLFTRELVSYSVVSAAAPAWCEVIHDHDTALNLSASDLRSHPPAREQPLLVMRRDAEAHPAAVRLEHAVDPAKDCRSLEEWVTLHDRATQVVTDRLHSAIVGSVLGVPATLVPNSYFKNRAVWEYSLQARGVKWSEGVPQALADTGGGRRCDGQ